MYIISTHSQTQYNKKKSTQSDHIILQLLTFKYFNVKRSKRLKSKHQKTNDLQGKLVLKWSFVTTSLNSLSE